MSKTKLLAALGVGIILVAAHGFAQPAPPTERIPTDDSFDNAYPRWLSWTNVDASLTTGSGNPTIQELAFSSSLTVDSQNTVHVLARYGTGPIEIAYYNNAYESRRSNGFSARVTLDGPDSTISEGDIVAAADDTLHAIWIKGGNIFWRKKTSTGWGGAVNLTNVIAGEQYAACPQIAIDGGGTAHIVSRYQKTPTSPWELMYLTWTGSGSPTKQAVTGATNTSGTNTARIVLTAGGVPHVVWQENDAPIRQVYYSNRATGKWSRKVAFGAAYVDNKGPDIAMDSAGVVHLAHARGDGHIYYRQGITGTEIKVSTIPDGFSEYARILADSRDQVHVLWNALSYGARVKNPDPAVLSAGFFTQEKVVMPLATLHTPNTVWEVARTANDQIHATDTRGYYTRTMDYEMAGRDPAAIVGAFPGANINTTNGNLHFVLPLFTAAGVGPAYSASAIFNSLETYAGFLAPGWRLNSEVYLIDHWRGLNDPTKSTGDEPKESLTLFLADGRAVHFTFKSYVEGTPAQCYLVAEDEYGWFDKIERSAWNTLSPGYKLTTKTGDVLTFNGNGKLAKVEEPTGNYMELNYGATGRLETVRDMLGNGGSGRTTTIAYEVPPSQLYAARVNKITDATGREYEFGYTGRWLTTIKFLSGPSQPTYGVEYYSANNFALKERINLPKQFRTPRGQAAGPQYGWTCNWLPDNRADKVTDPAEEMLLDGETIPTIASVNMALAYNELGHVLSLRETTLTNRRGFQTKFKVKPRQSLAKEIHDSAYLAGWTGIVPTVREFNAYGMLTDWTDRWNAAGSVTYYGAGTFSNARHIADAVDEVYLPSSTGIKQRVRKYLHQELVVGGAIGIRVDNVTSYSGGAGRLTDLDWNSSGQLSQVTYPNVTRPDGVSQTGVNTSYAYLGPRKQLSSVTNEEGNVTNILSWDLLHGLPTSVQRPGGTQTEDSQYDVMGNLFRHKLPAGATGNDPTTWTTLNRDTMYRLDTVVDPQGAAVDYDYDVDSNVILVIPPQGGSTSTVWDKRGFARSGSGPDGNWERWVNAHGSLRRHKNERNFESNFAYDLLDRMSQSKIPGASTVGGGGGGPSEHVTDFLHDQFDGTDYFTQATQVGDASNPDRVTKTAFDRRGRTKYVLAPDLATKTETFYDELDQVLASQISVGGTTQSCSVIFRDARDRVDHVRQQNVAYGGTPTAQADTYTIFNKSNSAVRVVDPLGSPTGGNAHTTQYLRDARERVQFVVDGKGVTVRQNVYGDDDLLSEVKIPDPETKTATLVTGMKYTYTSRKELKTTRNRNDVGLTYTYELTPGQVQTVTDALGRLTRTLYEPISRRPVELRVAEGTLAAASTFYEWTNGLLTATRVWNPSTLAYDAYHRRYYDQANRVEKLEAPIVATEYFAFNPFGELRQTVQSTKTITHVRNSLGQVTDSQWTGAWSMSLGFGYNGIGQTTRIEETAGLPADRLKQERDYNSWNGTPTTERFFKGGTLWKYQTHAVDVAGNYTGLTDAEGKAHGWTPDENNRTKDVSYDGAASSHVEFTPGGLVDYVDIKDATGALIARTTEFYDGLGRRTRSHTVKTAGGATLSDIRWEYTVLDQVWKIHYDHSNIHYELGYDERGNLTSETITGAVTQATVWTVDKIGNRLTQLKNGIPTTYLHNAASQLLSETTAGAVISYLHDPWGNQITRSSATATETFAYDYLNRLNFYSNSAASDTWSYITWPGGDRYAIINTLGGSTEKALFVPRFGDVTTEYTQVGTGPITLANSYIQGTGIDSKHVRVPASGGAAARRHYIGDQVGTVAVTLDDAANVASSIARDVWGNTISGTSVEAYGFAQREHDQGTGLMYYRARMYDPRLGRFIQTEPPINRRAAHHYVYGQNNPARLSDPGGN